MKSVLLLVHRIPYPPDKGDKIRSYNILRYLGSRYRVFLGAFVDDPEDFSHRSYLEDYCEDICLLPTGAWRSKLRAALSLARGQALGVGYYRDQTMSRWVRDVLEHQKIDGILVFSSVMAQYIPGNLAVSVPVISDFVDVDSDKWRQYSLRAAWPLSAVYRYEARALLRWERHAAKASNVVTLVSDTETKLMTALLADDSVRVETVRNGVETKFFDPRLNFECPYADGNRVVVFTGAMDYFANQEAVTWFAGNAWPEIQDREPDLRFYIVGSNPSRAVRELENLGRITVTGRVPDIRPYLNHAALAIAPLKLARGVQNKVLEALAMNTAVVASPAALQGLDDRLPDTVKVAKRGPGFARTVIECLATPGSGAGDSGREFVRENYDWERNLTSFSELLFPDRGNAQ